MLSLWGIPLRAILLLLPIFISGCAQNAAPERAENLQQLPWTQIEAHAKGSTVHFTMWQGDPLINRYMAEYVVPEVKKRYGVTLEIAPGQGTEIVKNLLAEKEAGKAQSSLDMCWINGETFFQLRQIEALYGPFSQQLPNAQYIDFDNPFIGFDFQQKTEGYECPWGNVQMALIYDSVRTPKPPRTLEALEQYVRAHPGKFTVPYEFTGMTLLKSWMIALAGDPAALNGPFDEEKYAQLSARLWDFINRNKPYFWRAGKTFPESLAATHQMFANGELDFTMSNNDSEVDNKILQKIFPPTARAYVFDSGTIQNSHFLGIPARAANKAGALVVINFMIAPEAQLEKLQPAVWGDGTVLAMEKLPADWRRRFENIPEHRHAPRRSDILAKALQEPAPEYMIRLYSDFRRWVIEG
ncbi:MAG: ABC transporter substrate-binding protein [Lewinellaceae bacterium]|nr:ABC transporter substrate-binding protein [Lewinellaceae bacterium]